MSEADDRVGRAKRDERGESFGRAVAGKLRRTCGAPFAMPASDTLAPAGPDSEAGSSEGGAGTAAARVLRRRAALELGLVGRGVGGRDPGICDRAATLVRVRHAGEGGAPRALWWCGSRNGEHLARSEGQT